MNGIFVIAKKEFMDNWRNKWIIATSAIFLILTLVTSYFSTGKWSDIGSTIAGMETFVILLIPIISLMLGYATIAGEAERGSLSLILSYPINRKEVIIGKFFGLCLVVATTIFLGFGIAGIVIAIKAGIDAAEYLSFLIASLLLSMSYISISILFSSLLKKRSTALGTAIFIWFLFSMIWGMILFGILVIKYGMDIIMQESWIAPDWYYIAAMINPNQSFEMFVAANVKPLQHLQRIYLPSYCGSFSPLVLILWIIIPLILAIFFFENRDL